MSIVELIDKKLEKMPTDYQLEVLQFINNLDKADKKITREDSVLSESALGDWNSDEEDKAWKIYQ